MSPHAAMSRIEMDSNAGNVRSLLVNGGSDDYAESERDCAHYDRQCHIFFFVQFFPKVVWRDPVKDHEEDHEDDDANDGEGHRAEDAVHKIRTRIHSYLPPL